MTVPSSTSRENEYKPIKFTYIVTRGNDPCNEMSMEFTNEVMVPVSSYCSGSVGMV